MLFPILNKHSKFNQMKKTILAFALAVVMAGTISTVNGQEPDSKSVKARENLKEAKTDLKVAQKDSASEYQKYRKEQDAKFTDHQKSIADFKARIAKEKAENKAQYEKKLAVLEQKNTDLKKRLDDYKEAGKDKWASFTNKFNHDMDELGTSLKNFTVGKKS